MRRKRLYYIIFIITALSAFYWTCPNYAEAGDNATATLRILATGDLHGQITSYNCETNQEMPKKGFSRLATLIRQKRAETGENNTLLVDAGDFFYDYTTNYFYNHDKALTQPILRAMASTGYDYITLGNHEFDYPWDYLKHQLETSGFSNRVLVCNTVWHDSGKQVFSPSAVVTKTLTASDHTSVSVRIGIVGSTTNSISTRRGDYVNEIDAVNNYDSIVAEANRLKSEEKADLVLVILHGGIGSENPGKKYDNVGYALTKVPSIDAIVTAHTHELFPKAENPDIRLSHADNHTGCINGKPVVATSSHAYALGMIDLTLQVNPDGTIGLRSGKSGISYAYKAKEDPEVKALFSSYLKKLKTFADTTSYKIKKGITYHNYDTVVQDSNLYQLFNDAKIAYGLTYLSEYLPQYKNIPVIACTRNLPDGSYPWIFMKDTLSPIKISEVLSESSSSRPSGYIKMYEVTGQQLREWLEYNAGIYASEGTRFQTILSKYTGAHKTLSTLLQEKYVYNWSCQYVFDGISYQIDLSKKPRYSSTGNLVSSKNSRIKSLTHNGTGITDSQKFLLVTDSGIPDLPFLPDEYDDSIKKVKDNETSKNITLNYIRELSAAGSIAIKADHNWSLTADKGYSFLLGVSKRIAGTVSKLLWNRGKAAETTSYTFYKGTLPSVSQSINVVAAQGRKEINNEPVPIVISASSKYALREIRYLPGAVPNSSAIGWQWASIVKNNTFTVNDNGVYTILVKDVKGNSTLTYINVDRYASNILPSPKLNRLTNRNSTISGTALPYSTIHITIGSRSYSTRVELTGRFSFTIKPPKAFDAISAYIDLANRKSAATTAAVRKTGPNAVQLNSAKAGDTYITGRAPAYTYVYALIRKTIYIDVGKSDAYKRSDFYKPAYKVVGANVTMNADTGDFKIPVSTLKSNMKVYVYCVDRFDTTSKSTMILTR